MKGRAKLGNCGYAFKHSKKMHLQWKTLGKNTGKILRFELNKLGRERVYCNRILDRFICSSG